MQKVRDLLQRLRREEDAEVAIEYGLLVALVALALIAVFTLFSTEVGNFYNRIMAQVINAPPGLILALAGGAFALATGVA